MADEAKPSCAGIARHRDGHRLDEPTPCRSPSTESVRGRWYCAAHAHQVRQKVQLAQDEIRDRFRSIASTAAAAHKHLDDLEALGSDIEEVQSDLARIIYQAGNL